MSDSELDVRDRHSADLHADVHADDHAHTHRDPMAEPSVDWGWHGTFPKASRIGGWAFVAIFLVMLIGNHEGHVEDLWLIGLALLTTVVMVRDLLKRRASWRR